MLQGWRRAEVYTGIRWETLRGKSQLGRLRSERENNIKMGPQKIG
jgi:hypothetical protein